MSHNILLVEDDPSLGKSIATLLKSEGFQVFWSKNLEDARIKCKDSINLIVLDWMLPDGQGVDFLKDLRMGKIVTPVIMLTARVDLIDKIIGLESGANDYMTKPFEPRELIARIRVQLRHTTLDGSTKKNSQLESGAIKVNLENRDVFFKDKKLELTKMEYALLKLLMESPGRAFSREELLNKVWGYENYPTTRTVDTHILQLRQKTSDDLIETIRGIGYRFKTVYKS